MGIANQTEPDKYMPHPAESGDRSRAISVAGSDLTDYANPSRLSPARIASPNAQSIGSSALAGTRLRPRQSVLPLSRLAMATAKGDSRRTDTHLLRSTCTRGGRFNYRHSSFGVMPVRREIHVVRE